MTMTKKMTPIEAVEFFDYGYAQAELQYIWENGCLPITEIMDLGCSRGQAQRLWNARPKNKAEWLGLEADILVTRARNDALGLKQPYTLEDRLALDAIEAAAP